MSQVHSVTHVPVHSLPLAAFAVVLAFEEIRAGVAGRNRPAEVGGGGPGGRSQGGNFLPASMNRDLSLLLCNRVEE